MKYSGGYARHSPWNTIAALQAGITTCSVQMAPSGVAHRFQQHGLQIALSIATDIILCGMSDFGASVHRTNLEIMSLLTSNIPAGSQRISNTQRSQHHGSWCRTLLAPCSPRIRRVSTYSLYCERPPQARSPPYNAHRQPWPPPEVDFSLHEDAQTAQQVQCNMFIRACLPRPHTKNYVIWGSFSMEWKGGEWNEPVPAWSCNPVSTRRKPRAASHI